MLCCHSLRAGPCITYKERRFTGTEITDDLFCFDLSCGRKRNVQSAISDMPAIRSKGGASRCQLMTEPTGYSITSNSANALGGIESRLPTFSMRKSNTGGISFPFVRLPFSKL